MSILDRSDALKEFDEVYEVVKTVEVVHNRRMHRIEVLKCLKPGRNFHVRHWLYDYVNVQPSYPRSGEKFERKTEDLTILIQGQPFSVYAPDVESALTQALAIMREWA